MKTSLLLAPPAIIRRLDHLATLDFKLDPVILIYQGLLEFLLMSFLLLVTPPSR